MARGPARAVAGPARGAAGDAAGAAQEGARIWGRQIDFQGLRRGAPGAAAAPSGEAAGQAAGAASEADTRKWTPPSAPIFRLGNGATARPSHRMYASREGTGSSTRHLLRADRNLSFF